MFLPSGVLMLLSLFVPKFSKWGSLGMNSNSITHNTYFPSLATPNVYPRSAEANGVQNTSEKPLSPETQQALNRWFPKQDDFYGLFPQANKNRLSDFLAHPIKNFPVVIGMSITAVEGLSLAMLLLGLNLTKEVAKDTPTEAVALGKIIKRGAIWQGAVVLFWGGLTFLDYLYQKKRNKDTLKGIQTLGDNATRQDWIDYKKAHPKMSKI
jgi:hypothetical protein